jgi:hypothetical protein
MSAKSSSAGKRPAKPRQTARKAARPAICHAARQPPEADVRDADARDALAWLGRGMPDDEVTYDDDAPRLTKEQLAEFEPASFVIRQRRK